MARKILIPWNFNKNELQNAVVQNLASAPSSPVKGQFYYDTVSDHLFWWNGAAWVAADGSSVTFGNVVAQTAFGASSSNGSGTAVSHDNHAHGTPTHVAGDHAAIKISDLAAPSADVAWNAKKITGLLDPTGGQDAATKAYVDAAAAGIDWKASVRVASTANLALSGAQTIDGISAIAGDRVLVKDQTSGAENGIYVVAAGGWARATDADAAAEVTAGFAVFVEQGTANADTGWVLTTDGAIVVGTTPIAFTQFTGIGSLVAGAGLTKTGNTVDVGAGTGIAVAADSIAIDHAVVPKIFAANVGDGAATSYNIDHNLGTTDVVVQVYTVSDGTQVECDVTRSTTNRVVLAFTTAPTTNQFRVTILG